MKDTAGRSCHGHASLVIKNAAVWTGHPNGRREAIAVLDDKDYGNREQWRDSSSHWTATKVVDAGGKLVLPALTIAIPTSCSVAASF
jgi:predicted amidohydrolase YtcJ